MSYKDHLVETLANAQIMGMVRRKIAKRLPDQDVDDVMQETMLKAWRYIDDFRGDCAISTWLVLIASNMTADHYANAARRAQPSDVDPDELHGDIEVAEDYETDQQRAWLYANIAAMPREWREIMIAKLEGYGEEHIAAALNIEVGTVKSRAHRAKQVLTEVYHAQTAGIRRVPTLRGFDAVPVS